MTNGDRIRAMNNAELAQFLCQIGDCVFGFCAACIVMAAGGDCDA